MALSVDLLEVRHEKMHALTWASDAGTVCDAAIQGRHNAAALGGTVRASPLLCRRAMSRVFTTWS